MNAFDDFSTVTTVLKATAGIMSTKSLCSWVMNNLLNIYPVKPATASFFSNRVDIQQETNDDALIEIILDSLCSNPIIEAKTIYQFIIDTTNNGKMLNLIKNANDDKQIYRSLHRHILSKLPCDFITLPQNTPDTMNKILGDPPKLCKYIILTSLPPNKMEQNEILSKIYNFFLNFNDTQ